MSYPHDVYIAYSKQDRDFVRFQLLRELENKNGLRCCVPERDFPGNGVHFEHMCDYITQSQIILIILSNSSLNDHAISFASRFANNSRLDNQYSKKIIYIKLESTDCIDSHFQSIIDCNTCLEFPKRDSFRILQTEQQFFERLVSKILKEVPSNRDSRPGDQSAGEGVEMDSITQRSH